MPWGSVFVIKLEDLQDIYKKCYESTEYNNWENKFKDSHEKT